MVNMGESKATHKSRTSRERTEEPQEPAQPAFPVQYSEQYMNINPAVSTLNIREKKR